MNAIEITRLMLMNAHYELNSALEGLSDAQLNWKPQGIPNPIKASALHVLASQDFFVHVLAQGQAPLWETERWGEKFGINQHLGSGEPWWDEVKNTPMTTAMLRAYADAVQASTISFVETLVDQDLDCKVRAWAGEQPLADLLCGMVTHGSLHAGEIEAIKGMQGLRGAAYTGEVFN
jgi:uncharacterized damage-inducible protein DinB